MCCSRIEEASCSQEHVTKSSKKNPTKVKRIEDSSRRGFTWFLFASLLENNSSLSPQADQLAGHNKLNKLN
jgi:hypothetical protein